MRIFAYLMGKYCIFLYNNTSLICKSIEALMQKVRIRFIFEPRVPLPSYSPISSKKSYIKNKLEHVEGADVKTVYRTVNGLLNNGNKIQSLADDFALLFKKNLIKSKTLLKTKEDMLTVALLMTHVIKLMLLVNLV